MAFAKNPLRILQQDHVNKKILAKQLKIRRENELLGPYDRYRDENKQIYQKKLRQFYESCREYKENNKLALLNTANKLGQFSDEKIKYNFEDETPVCEKKYNEDGAKIRKRTRRTMHENIQYDTEICNLEPWFSRYLILSKFVTAVRTVILYNRLIKNLDKLKTVDTEQILELENQHKKCENISYAEVFAKFIK